MAEILQNWLNREIELSKVSICPKIPIRTLTTKVL
jgi:hypothetical protein